MKKNVLELRPTQFAVGMLEVDEKIKELLALSKKKFRNYFDETSVPVVLGPEGGLYVVDHHHFLAVAYHLEIKKVRVEIVLDHSRSGMNFTQFWRWMKKTRHTYPFCQFGEGPRAPYYLPRDIRGLADDPYRSLAWFVRKAGAFENSDRNFAEFKWANFFRSKRLLDKEGILGFAEAAEKAVKLAQSKAAAGLPGFKKLTLVKQREAKKSVVKRVKGTAQKSQKP